MLNLVVKNHTALLAYSSGGWKATMGLPGLKPRSRQGGFLREAPGESIINLFPCLFQFLAAAQIPWHMAPPFPSKPAMADESRSHRVTLILTLLLPSPRVKDSCGHTGLTWIIQATVPIVQSSD